MSKLHYLQPAATWNEALPLGNGRLGAMIFGGAALDRIQLNEDSVWSGGFEDRVNRSAREHMPRLQELIAQGCIREAEQLALRTFAATSDNERQYEPLADVLLFFTQDNPGVSLHATRSPNKRDMRACTPAETAQYARTLDLATGLHEVRYHLHDQDFRREAFISAPDQVMCLRAAGHPFDVLQRRGAQIGRMEAVDERTVVLSGMTANNGVRYACAVRVIRG